MGMMGDAFTHLKDQGQPVPVILPLPPPAFGRHGARAFCLPELPETPEPMPASRAPQVLWPESPARKRRPRAR